MKFTYKACWNLGAYHIQEVALAWLYYCHLQVIHKKELNPINYGE